MPMSPRLLRPLASRSLSDADATAYLAAVEAADGQALEPAVRNAVTAFVLGCKSDGIWDAIKASCILAGARTLAGALVPLRGTAPTNNGPFVSGDYNRETGLVGNASTKYLDSNRAGDADPQNDHHMSVFQSNLGTGSPMGSGAGSPGATHLAAASGGQFGARNRSSSFAGTGVTAAVGFVGTSRTEAASFTIRYPGGSQALSVTSQTPYPLSYWVFGRNDATPGFEAFSDARLAFYSIGESLDLAALDGRVSALITAIGAAI